MQWRAMRLLGVGVCIDILNSRFTSTKPLGSFARRSCRWRTGDPDERLRVCRDWPHGTGVESSDRRRSQNDGERRPSCSMTRQTCSASYRSRLLYPGCSGMYGNRWDSSECWRRRLLRLLVKEQQIVDHARYALGAASGNRHNGGSCGGGSAASCGCRARRAPLVLAASGRGLLGATVCGWEGASGPIVGIGARGTAGNSRHWPRARGWPGRSPGAG
jgi:hypothetical protein